MLIAHLCAQCKTMMWISVCVIGWGNRYSGSSALACSLIKDKLWCTGIGWSPSFKGMKIPLDWAYWIDTPHYFAWRVFCLSISAISKKKTQIIKGFGPLPLSFFSLVSMGERTSGKNKIRLEICVCGWVLLSQIFCFVLFMLCSYDFHAFHWLSLGFLYVCSLFFVVCS